MATHRKPKHVSPSHAKRNDADKLDLLPLSALIGLAGGFLIFFLVAEVGFYSRTHPLHWLTAAGGGALGYLIGLAYERRRATSPTGRPRR